MPFPAGARFGPYEVLSPLGAGGMGEVYRARDTRLDRAVAVKVLSSSSSEAPSRLERFQREARAISRLSHPHICTLHDLGEQDGVAFLVMEYVEGQTLAERLEEGPLPLDQALRCAVEIADALSVAHRQGVIHRDLKPANVMLTRQGVKLLDFGLAKLTQADGDAARETTTESVHLTEEGTLLGTVAYMAPEQLEGSEADARTDIFALGAVLYEMATGRRPFVGKSRASLIAAIISSEPPPVATLQPMTPPALERVVQRCLAKDPDDRWQSARDLAAELRWILEGGSEAGVPRRTAARRRSRSMVWGSVIGAALAAAVFAWMWGREGARLAAPSFSQVTFRRGYLTDARFDPATQTIVYGASWEGGPRQLFSTRQGSYESRVVGETARVVSISRSGEMALILDQGNGILARAPLAGGAPRELLERVRDADWAPDGSDIAVVRRLGPSKFVVEWPIGKAIYESQSQIWNARVSPKGDRIAMSGMFGSGRADVMVIDRSGARTILAKGWAWLRGIAWAPGGDEVWFTASRAGTREPPALWAVSLAGRERLVARTPVELFLHDISADGRVLLAVRHRRAGMRCLPPGAANEKELGWLDYSWVEALSSDGKTILFGDGPLDEPAVYVRPSDGAPAIRLGEGIPRALSPDGTWVLAAPPGANRWFLLPTRAGTPRELPRGSIVRLETAEWLDGDHLALSGDEAGHPDRIYVQDIENGAIRIISQGGFILPPHASTTPDGKALLALERPGDRWFLLPADGGDPRPLLALGRGDEPLQWSADGRILYVAHRSVATPETAADVYRVEIPGGRRELFKRLTPPDPAGVEWIERIALTPDGRSYCYTYTQNLGTLYVAEGLK